MNMTFSGAVIGNGVSKLSWSSRANAYQWFDFDRLQGSACPRRKLSTLNPYDAPRGALPALYPKPQPKLGTGPPQKRLQTGPPQERALAVTPHAFMREPLMEPKRAEACAIFWREI